MSNQYSKTAMLCLLITICSYGYSQDSSKADKIISIPDKVFSALDKKTSSIEQRLNKQTEKYLDKFQKRESKLRKKLWKKDSTLAKQLFDGVDEKYGELKNLTGNVNKYAAAYSGHLLKSCFAKNTFPIQRTTVKAQCIGSNKKAIGIKRANVERAISKTGNDQTIKKVQEGCLLLPATGKRI